MQRGLSTNPRTNAPQRGFVKLQYRITLIVLAVFIPLMGLFIQHNVSSASQQLEDLMLRKAKANARTGAIAVSRMLEEAIENGELTEAQVFDTNYQRFWEFNPAQFPDYKGDPRTLDKYHTAYDEYLDKYMIQIIDAYLLDSDVLFAVPVDRNGYLPTHNTRWSSWDGNPATDRSKRIFNDPVGLKAAQNLEPTLQQIYERPDTGETVWDVSAPIYVNGKHWGAFRVAIQLAQNQATIIQTTRTNILAGIAVTALFVFFALLLGRYLATPIVQLTKAAQDVQSGRLIEAVVVQRRDETAILTQSFNAMVRELKQTFVTLEQRVAELHERSQEVAFANETNARRARQFEAISQVTGSITSVRSLEELLPRVAQLISDAFNFYHVGIFLNDDSNQYAVLSAANSEGGRRMLARGHRLQVGAQGIVGYVTGTGNPRVALDTGADAVYFDNPDLPGTRSEMALPLTIAGKVIGALDVQSLEPNAFEHQDIEVLSTLANQVSLAIQNARSFLETQKLLAESQSMMTGYITESWKVLRPASLTTGYEKVGPNIKPLEQKSEGEHINKALEHGRTAQETTKLAVPIRLRGQVIGVLNLQMPEGQQWSANEVGIAEAVAERLSLAIETATLIKATQHRANIERVTSDITGRISTSSHLETILQIAAQELNRALGGSDVLVQIEPVSMKLSSSG